MAAAKINGVDTAAEDIVKASTVVDKVVGIVKAKVNTAADKAADKVVISAEIAGVNTAADKVVISAEIAGVNTVVNKAADKVVISKPMQRQKNLLSHLSMKPWRKSTQVQSRKYSLSP